MPWQASLDLAYRLDDRSKTVLAHRHDGPLRVFHSLYPEGPAICHNVIVHPPGGLVEGDTLTSQVEVAQGAHGLISTPGATRFYRSDGLPATQQVHVHLSTGARLEWVPLETIAYPGCQGINSLEAVLDEGAEWIGWDVTALGLPGSGLPFERGCLQQRLSVQGCWLEQGRLDAADTRLMDAPMGLAGHRCIGSLWLATGTPLSRQRREHLLQALQGLLPDTLHPLAAGVTCPSDRVLVLRVLGPLVEPVMTLIQTAWGTLRQEAWDLPGAAPRIWQV